MWKEKIDNYVRKNWNESVFLENHWWVIYLFIIQTSYIIVEMGIINIWLIFYTLKLSLYNC